ncbi:MAG: hypothetical protein PHW92_09205 [Lutibacter sp.]|nr:hypothetical protein [Lutibacter sp.]
MQLNFSLKKAWNDLFGKPKYIIQLLIVTVICIILELLGTVYSIKGPKFLSSIVITGYTCLIAYNIINSKEEVLENIFNNSETGKFILLVGLKAALIDAIYLVLLFLPPVFYLGLYFGFKHFPAELSTIIVMLILSPLLFYVTIFPTITFAEEFKFIDGFNFVKAFRTLKIAWKDYLLCFLIMSAILFGLFILGFISYNLFILSQNKSLNINSILSYFSHINWSFISIKLPQNILFFNFGGVISSYFGTHIVAQVYKYTLNKESKNSLKHN